MTQIRINNIGPIEEFAYELNGYGLHVVKGVQGAGKTTILRTVQLAVDGRTDIRPGKRDGTPRGEAEVAGKTIRIVKQIREEGELSVDGLGDLSIADLHSPNFKDATTRDRHRIKTLTRLAGVKADASLFWYLLTDRARFESIVPTDSLRTDDLVEMASRVKRAIEREAQHVEDMRETALADARAQASIVESTDMSFEHDATKLQNELEEAIREQTAENAKLQTLNENERNAKEAKTKADAARVRLATLGSGITVAEAIEAQTKTREASAEAERVVAALTAQLSEAKVRLQAAVAAHVAAHDAVQQAQREEELHAELHAAIDNANVIGPTEDEIMAQFDVVGDAGIRVASAKSAVTEGVKVRAAIAAQTKAEEHQETAKVLTTQAKRLRDAATDTADVLTAAISKLNDCPLKIALTDEGDPRLVIATDRDECEPFDELSDGEKWIHVVRIAATSNRLIVLPQAAFGELSPSSKEQLHVLAMDNRCYILSAVADDCELHGESFSTLNTQAAE